MTMKTYKFNERILTIIPYDQSLELEWRVNAGTYWTWTTRDLKQLYRRKDLHEHIRSLRLPPFPTLVEALYDLEEA